jgi:hypothetical protein
MFPSATRCASAKTAFSPAAAPRLRRSPRSPPAHQLLTWVFYAMRDGRVRALASSSPKAVAFRTSLALDGRLGYTGG